MFLTLLQIANSETCKHEASAQSPEKRIHSDIYNSKKSYNIVLGTQRTSY
jgi:hypothetical protein